MSEKPSAEDTINTLISLHNATGDLYPRIFDCEKYAVLSCLASKVQAQAEEIVRLQREIEGYKSTDRSEDASQESLKRPRAAHCAESVGDFLETKKPKVDKRCEPQRPPSPKRRDKFTREERRRLPGYSTPDSAAFYKAFADEYDEQTLLNKLSECRYEFPPAQVSPSYYSFDKI